jgi:hypothetical protein
MEPLDVIEASEMLDFVANWLSLAGLAVAADLACHLAPAVYPLDTLIADCRRLATALSGPDPDW